MNSWRLAWFPLDFWEQSGHIFALGVITVLSCARVWRIILLQRLVVLLISLVLLTDFSVRQSAQAAEEITSSPQREVQSRPLSDQKSLSNPLPVTEGLAPGSLARRQLSPQEADEQEDPQPAVALTFDDGPSPGYTTRYLEVLRERKAPATFFVIAQQAQKYPELIKAMVEQGFEVGSHSLSHRRLPPLAPSEIAKDLSESKKILLALGVPSAELFRPPYGSVDTVVENAAASLSQSVVLWDIDPRDWEGPEAENIKNQILEHAGPESIILLHEGKPQTLEALPEIIDALRAEGFRLVTVSEILQAKNGSRQSISDSHS